MDHGWGMARIHACNSIKPYSDQRMANGLNMVSMKERDEKAEKSSPHRVLGRRRVRERR
jgi:hypothetical protein